ncbi:MAG: radical SAM protein [Desulfopila sp.]|jgi:radical SAM superfamily enzyme YgiQ (UPF0313 family)|nr:radical SAM protein [Desulfopila sp.]
MLLFHPPVAKPSEAPAGIAQLAGALLAHNHPCSLIDLNLEGQLFLLNRTGLKKDTWSRRAQKNFESNLTALRSKTLYQNFSRYQKSVLEINRLLEIQGIDSISINLANYLDTTLSPLNSDHLYFMAEHPEKNLFYPFFTERIPALLEKLAPRAIGISINYLSQALNSFALIGYLKRLAPGIPVVAGGGLITSWMSNPARPPLFKGLIDHCIAGRGEAPLLKLLGITGEKASCPRYDLLPITEYMSPGFILPFSCSSGCFWNKCTFCPERAEGHNFYGKNHSTVLTELTALKQHTTPVLIHFLDNAIPPSLLSGFSTSFPGMPWYGFARITEHLLDIDFCRNLKRSGCVMLKLGVESGDQGVLDQMEKGLDLEVIGKVLQNLKYSGIATYIYLLFGTPAESLVEARKTLQFIRQHHETVSYLNLAIFNMPLNSKEEHHLVTSPFSHDDLSLYTDFHHPHGWNRKEVRLFLDKEFRKDPRIAAILKRDPPFFTSNHAPFFCMENTKTKGSQLETIY